jgi:hypothetical protein
MSIDKYQFDEGETLDDFLSFNNILEEESTHENGCDMKR